MLQRSESVTLAFLVLLETLAPEERAVFLLKEVFDYAHAEIGEMLGISRGQLPPAPASCEGARRGGAAAVRRDVRFAPGDGRAIRAALHAGDAASSPHCSANTSACGADGGGKVTAARRPLSGRAAVLNFLLGLHRIAVTSRARPPCDAGGQRGQPRAGGRHAGRRHGWIRVYVLSMEDDAIAALRIVRNPDKLRYIDRQLTSRLM